VEPINSTSSNLPKIRLNKLLTARTVAMYYDNSEFPDCIYICLENDLEYGLGTIINASEETEKGHFVSKARIDKLIVNIPTKEEFISYFEQKYNVTNLKNITPEMKFNFWENYSWHFVPEIFETDIEWE
jgi:hypothetical protein